MTVRRPVPRRAEGTATVVYPEVGSLVLPLSGFEGPSEPIDLGDVSIVPLDTEWVRDHSMYLPPTHIGGSLQLTAIRHALVLENPDKNQGFLTQSLWALSAERSYGLDCVALLNTYSGGHTGFAFARSGSRFAPGNLAWVRGYRLTLTEEQIPALRTFWQEAWSPQARERSGLWTAIRRVGLTADATLGQAVVEAVIAAEALFLADNTRPEQLELGGENAFRLALRVAWFVGDGPDSRKQIFDLIQRAYRHRNVVVHGGANVPSEWAEESLLLAVMRRALLKSVPIAARKGPQESLAEWTNLVLGR